MHKKIISVVLLIALVSFACKKSDYREVNKYTIEQFMDTVSISGSSFSADETKILFSSNQTGIYNAFTIPVEGGEPTQITQSEDDAIFVISFFPNDNRILYSSDKGGNEINHIYLLNEDGTVKDLTPDEKAKSMFMGWSFDEKSFFYGSNKRDQRFFDVYEMNVETFTPKMVYQNDEGYFAGAISRDKRYFALVKSITNHNSNMYLYDRETQELKHLFPHEDDVNYSPQTFSTNSKNLYFLTDENNEFTYLKRYDIETGQSDIIEQADWDIWYSYFSRNGKYRVTGINEDAQTVIKVYETDTNQPIPLPELPGGNITSVNISKSEKLMTFYFNGSRSPNNLYTYNFETEKYTKLTDTMNPGINTEDLVNAEIVRYKSFDNLEIPAVYYKPHQIKSEKKAPALVMVHGGPGGQARIGYNPYVQFLVNHGYLVIDVNNRGSSGYGKTFFKMDDKKHGDVDLDDCVEAKKFLITTGYVDENKIGIIGGSYGGYMVLAALTFRPDAFAVGVDLFGISNWVRTLKMIPPWWESFKKALYEELGNPETELEYLRSISPLFHAEKIKKPLMVLQGANDPRVLKVESDEIVEAVKKNNVPVEYVIFDDEGHGFVKKENQIEGFKAVLKFLEKYLKGESEN
ncbi:MAG: S9 family peptidase [Candidatus Aminicenantes bacterium]|nr:MAG: S9 family peptidase [Candidatus Aminicenantes bacterium]